ncbi:MAG: 6-phosphogluconolactonase [Anaerolineae bacterium]|nr:6-phosphogluconolactonase [Anaerolineae bacterium]
MLRISVFPDPYLLVEHAAQLFAQQAVAARGRFSVALSGGSTPRALYERLASAEFSGRIPWRDIHLFWGDERCVPPDHADSNYRMTAESLLRRVPLPAENIHRIQGELAPHEAAAHYEAGLRAFFGGAPVFDLVLLGMGDDGHTASLFPDSPALAESARWAVAVEHTSPPPPLVSRVTLTFGVFNAARRVVFLVTGAGKAQKLAEIRRGADLPAGRIRPPNGDLLWLVDEAAAA